MESTPEQLTTSSPRRGPAPIGYARLRTGSLVDLGEWATAYAERRQLMRASAVQDLARGSVIFSHVTAAALHGLPLVGVTDAKVHATSAVAHPPKTRGDVIRHSLALLGDDITERGGLRVTSLERTVADVIRMLPPAAGLAVFDAALRQVAWDDHDHVIRPDEDSRLRAAVGRRIQRAAGGRGVRDARLVLAMGDGRAQLAGESLSRFRFYELGLPRPDLQTRVVTRLGVAFLDVAWPELRRFGEFDGEVKLYDRRYAQGRSAAAILASQAERRAAVEEATGWTGMHWGWQQAQDATELWRVMLDQGFPPRARLGG